METIALIDAALDATNRVAVCVLTGVVPGPLADPAPSRLLAPMERANARALKEVALAAMAGRTWPEPALLSVSTLAEETLESVFFGAVESAVWACLLSGLPAPARVVVAADPLLRELPGFDARVPSRRDLEAVVRRARHTTRGVFDGADDGPLQVVLAPYGVPATPVGLLIARCTAALALTDPAQIPIRAVPIPPSSELVRAQRMLESLQHATPDLILASEQCGSDGGVSSWLTGLLHRGIARLPSGRIVRAAFHLAVLRMEAALEMRSGAYHACERLMSLVWQDDADAPSMKRTFEDDPHLLARAWVVRARLANHRGSPEEANDAVDHVFRLRSRESSVRMLLIGLDAAILRAVAAQNQWPFEPEDAAGARALMANAASSLEQMMADMRELASLASRLVPGVATPDDPLDSDLGSRVEATNAEGADKDPLLAAAAGTLGRTYAFLGDHSRAWRHLRTARDGFVTRTDRRMNAILLGHVVLDERGATSAERLSRVLRHLVPAPLREPSAAFGEVDADPTFRFTLNLLLKALALGIEVPDFPVERWVSSLTGAAGGSLIASLDRVPSHPNELIARHAGELVRLRGREDDAVRFWDLARRAGASGGPTVAKLSRFTEHLARHGGTPDASAPRGSVLNPCFEYR